MASGQLDSVGGRKGPLDIFFSPSSVAVIGATETPGTVGRALMGNLSTAGNVRVYPVNPKRTSVFGLPCYPSIAALPGPVELAVVITPAQTVPGVIRECAAAGIRGAIVIAAGFRETGPEGAKLEQEVLSEARKGHMRLLGPNCLGLMSPHRGFNASFAQSMARPGHLAFISQSGALCTAILDWAEREMVGFSAFVSTGSMQDIGWGDLILQFGDDPKTRSIILYMESVGDARSFVSAAREVALSKPIIVIKPGRTQAAARAAASHTGALTGEDDVLDAAFRRCGVLRVDTIAELFHLAEALDKQPRPKGPRLAIVTNAGGPAVLATDALLTSGGQLAEMSRETIAHLDALLPAHWSHSNPLDVLGDATAERYVYAMEAALKDPSTDGLLAIVSPQAVTNPGEIAQRMVSVVKGTQKPVLGSWMGGAGVAHGETLLNAASIPAYSYPDAAARVFSAMWRYSSNLQALYETPSLAQNDPTGHSEVQQKEVQQKIAATLEGIRASGRTLLTEAESKSVLASYGIPVVRTEVATTPDEAAAAAARMGYPVVVKLNSHTITHKTDVGGVRLNLGSEAAVREAFLGIRQSVERLGSSGDFLGVTVQPMVKLDGYELIIGSSVDPQFGPIVMFGAGGQLVEVYKDRSLGLPPLNTTLARRMTERTLIYRALGGVRGRKPVDLAALDRLLVQFSELVAGQPWIREIDMNPVLASPDGLLALDARMVLYPKDSAAPPKLAIRPYPVQYVQPWTFPDGEEVVIRPIRPEDEPLMVRFHESLSERSVYLRYFHLVDIDERTSHDRLIRICFSDFDREMALVAEAMDTASGQREILAVGRLSRLPFTAEAELAVLITDEYQGRGLGTEITQRLLNIGRAEGLRRITAELLDENVSMQKVCRELGFRMTPEMGGTLHSVLDLS